MLSERIENIINEAERFNRWVWIINILSVPLVGLIIYFITSEKNYNPSLFEESSIILYLYIVSFCLGFFSIGLRYYLFSDRKIKGYFNDFVELDLEFYAKDQKSKKVNFNLLKELRHMPLHEQKLVTLPGWISGRLQCIFIVNGMIALAGCMIGIATKTYFIIIGVLFLEIIMCPEMLKVKEKVHKLIKESQVHGLEL